MLESESVLGRVLVLENVEVYSLDVGELVAEELSELDEELLRGFVVEESEDEELEALVEEPVEPVEELVELKEVPVELVRELVTLANEEVELSEVERLLEVLEIDPEVDVAELEVLL